METLVGELPTGTTNPAPVITCWLPEGERTGSSIVILPGGGYGALAEHEAQGYAEYFAAAGIASFVVPPCAPSARARTSWVSIRIASALWDRRPVAI